MITILRWRVASKIRVATLNVKVTAWPCSKIVSTPLLGYLKSGFTNITQKWSLYWADVLCTTFRSLPWRSRLQHDLEAKSCPAHNFVIWSWILKRVHRNDHHIEGTCREQDLGRYLEGQDHSMTSQHNRVHPITWLFEVWFYNYYTKKWSPYWVDMSRSTIGSLPWRSRSRHDLAAKSCPAHNFVIWSPILNIFHINYHHIETPCRKQDLGRYLVGQGHSMTLQQKTCRAYSFVIWSRILQLFDRNDH